MEMKHVTCVYSPLCEANGAFMGQLREWLPGTEVELTFLPFPDCAGAVDRPHSENCFIDLYCDGKHIDSVPLHRDRICAALGIAPATPEADPEPEFPAQVVTPADFSRLVEANQIAFLPITPESYLEEMSMCLENYPFGNPPRQYHEDCIQIKSHVFQEAWQYEPVAGVYARMEQTVLGLLEVFPRELVRKYGYLTGATGADSDYLTVACYEVGFGIPRPAMLDALMEQLLHQSGRFRRPLLEGIGMPGCQEGFQPYWVYEKHGFHPIEQLPGGALVMEKALTK